MITKPQRVILANFLYGNDQSALGTISPASFYIGLSTASMTDAGTITGEVVGNGYTRVKVDNNKTSFSVADSSTDGVVRNQIQITWPEATASWGTIKTVFFAATQSGTEALYYIPVSKEVPAQATLYFNGNTDTGDLTLSVVN